MPKKEKLAKADAKVAPQSAASVAVAAAASEAVVATPEASAPPVETPAAPTPAPEPVNRMVTVCAKRTLNEEGKAYSPGMKFQTSPERARALGGLVEVEAAAN